MSLLQKLTQRDLLKQYASVMEQVLMSGSNMLASIVVLKVADVAQFGIYSFIFVLSTLVAGIFGTLLHRQMMLEIASENDTVRRRVFLATMAIEITGLIAFMGTVAVLAGILPSVSDLRVPIGIVLAGSAYMTLNIVFDAFKQFAYTTGNQIYSLRCTFIYVCMQILLLGAIVLFYDGAHVVEAAYAALSVSLIISLSSNMLCLRSLRDAQWQGRHYVIQVLSGFFKQGRFSLLGMGITWAQNQSMNPFLMLISGPTVAGYFSLGRLLIMPMAVVSQGLVNSSTPTLRRLYHESGITRLMPRIHTYLVKTTLFSALYISTLALAHFSGLLQRHVPDYQQVQWFLLVWIILASCSIVRFWHGQFFVVSMEFRFLMRVSIISLVVTATGMLMFGVGFKSIQLALLSVIAGELVALVIYNRKQSALLKSLH
ncbi:lipopolysaccharide biosynthesis protein [Granulosicoccus sp. 3-233]|uniref:lipopolysaccharide biosynthesis protein n=1 Tax=Granulosicoccus sp. 3-233 TaxID=3417969 RepID=UPI003D3350D6